MSTQSIEQLRGYCPEVDESLLREHVERLDEGYFELFEPERVAEHLRRLERLGPGQPVSVISRAMPGGRASITVLAMDYPAVFSLIAGVLAGMGFSIESGEVFTYSRRPEAALPGVAVPGARYRRRRGAQRHRQPPRRRIIDHFVGRVEREVPFEAWAQRLEKRLQAILGRLAGGDPKEAARARQQVNELVTAHLSELPATRSSGLQPVELKVVKDAGPFTRLRVVSQDTPAFLYALCTALSMHKLSIEHVRIKTVDHRVEDEIDFVDQRGRPVHDSDTLDKVRLSVLLTKQFTYFLGQAPDPYAALSRFEQWTERIVSVPESGRWVEQLSDPRTMQDLARLFGASDFLWEDFIRTQYEALLPMLRPHVSGRRFSVAPDELPAELERTLEGAESYEQQREALNRFKDRHVFLIDLDHILTPGTDFRTMAERLTALAELVVNKAAALVHEHLAERHGRPRTEAGEAAALAILGLGKLGGAALGYGSDIETLTVYDRDGRTDGKEPIANARFFERLVQEVSRFIEAKQEGIFRMDLRLRPYGDDGPLACSRETFDRYFAPDGPAHALERLALVRMRAIGGNAEVGAELERLRNHHLYDHPEALDLGELRDARGKGYREKARGPTFNAKHGCGGLSDLEFSVQTLQVQHGREHPALRTPRIHLALDALARIGDLPTAETEALREAYDFLRRLINGLRMLRGNALDLFLPADDSSEYMHLARRLDYQKRGDLPPERRLRLDVELATATVRSFVRRRFGAESLPDAQIGNLADLVLSEEEPAETLRRGVLERLGFREEQAAWDCLERLVRVLGDRRRTAQTALLAGDALAEETEPDRALEGWVQLLESLEDPDRHVRLVTDHPAVLAVLLGIFGRTRRAAGLLLQLPELPEWLHDPSRLVEPGNLEALEKMLGEAE